MFSKIWERYFFREVVKVFLLLIVSFYALYVLIDYSNRSSSFRHLHFTAYDLLLYYAFTFVQRLDILVPFAFLIAVIRMLTHLNSSNELVALLVGGIKLRSIIKPFLIMSLFFTALIYLNTEVLLPYAAQKLNKFEDKRFFADEGDQELGGVQSIVLKDKTTLIYQSFDIETDTYFDVYWVRSTNDIYRIKYLNIKDRSGQFVEHLLRDANGKLKLAETFEHKNFPDIVFSSKKLEGTTVSAENQSISNLWRNTHGSASDKVAKQRTMLHHKLVTPWLSFLVVIGVAPFCLLFSRQHPTFYLYAFSLFGLVALYLVMNAMQILGKNQVLNPFWAIWTAPALIGLIFGSHYLRKVV